MEEKIKHKLVLDADEGQQLLLNFSCEKLKIVGFYMISVSMSTDNKNFQQIDRTQISQESKDPIFNKPIELFYNFQEQQYIRIQLFICNSIKESNSKQKLGSQIFAVRQLVAKKNLLEVDFGPEGKAKIKTEVIEESNDDIRLSVRCISLKPSDVKKEVLNTQLAFYRFDAENNRDILIQDTNVLYKNNKPSFPNSRLKINQLCQCDFSKPFKIKLFYVDDVFEEPIGEALIQIDEIIDGKKNFEIINLKTNIPMGLFYLEKYQILQMDSFSYHLQNGLEICLAVAIDFTGSNSDIDDNGSLHNLNHGLNDYQQSIKQIGDILIEYDTDKQVPVYGFGAQSYIPGFLSEKVLHNFPLNGNPQNPEVHGIEGVLEIYNQNLPHLIFSGPTQFNPILTQVMKIASDSVKQRKNNYYILLILTDGDIDDMEQTIISLVDSARLPLSIIIIGVGNDDEAFKQMQILDGDEGLVDKNGRVAERDLVQFVVFNQYLKDGLSQYELSKKVLEEIPDQVCDYFRLIGAQKSSSNSFPSPPPNQNNYFVQPHYSQQYPNQGYNYQQQPPYTYPQNYPPQQLYPYPNYGPPPHPFNHPPNFIPPNPLLDSVAPSKGPNQN